jgi:hypothetical protein
LSLGFSLPQSDFDFVLIISWLTKVTLSELIGKLILNATRPGLGDHRIWPLLVGVAIIAFLVTLPHVGWLFAVAMLLFGLGSRGSGGGRGWRPERRDRSSEARKGRVWPAPFGVDSPGRKYVVPSSSLPPIALTASSRRHSNASPGWAEPDVGDVKENRPSQPRCPLRLFRDALPPGQRGGGS